MSDNWITVASKKKREQKRPNHSNWSDFARNVGKTETKMPQTTKTSTLPSPSSKTTPVASTIEAVHQINDTWVLWYHDLKSSDWSESAYEKLFSFNTVEDFWILYNNLSDLTNGMYYLMRNGIPPMWDHEKNINGGAWTFKVDKRNLNNFWRDLSCYCIGETICDQPGKIVGLSISPKIRYATVRVWTSDTNQNSGQFKKIAQESEKSSVRIDFNEARFTVNKEASI